MAPGASQVRPKGPPRPPRPLLCSSENTPKTEYSFDRHLSRTFSFFYFRPKARSPTSLPAWYRRYFRDFAFCWFLLFLFSDFCLRDVFEEICPLRWPGGVPKSAQNRLSFLKSGPFLRSVLCKIPKFPLKRKLRRAFWPQGPPKFGPRGPQGLRGRSFLHLAAQTLVLLCAHEKNVKTTRVFFVFGVFHLSAPLFEFLPFPRGRPGPRRGPRRAPVGRFLTHSEASWRPGRPFFDLTYFSCRNLVGRYGRKLPPLSPSQNRFVSGVPQSPLFPEMRLSLCA